MKADHEGALEWAKRNTRHYECEDSWYSCPLSEDGCANDANTECNCDAMDVANLKAAYLELRELALQVFHGDTREILREVLGEKE